MAMILCVPDRCKPGMCLDGNGKDTYATCKERLKFGPPQNRTTLEQDLRKQLTMTQTVIQMLSEAKDEKERAEIEKRYAHLLPKSNKTLADSVVVIEEVKDNGVPPDGKPAIAAWVPDGKPAEETIKPEPTPEAPAKTKKGRKPKNA